MVLKCGNAEKDTNQPYLVEGASSVPVVQYLLSRILRRAVLLNICAVGRYAHVDL